MRRTRRRCMMPPRAVAAATDVDVTDRQTFQCAENQTSPRRSFNEESGASEMSIRPLLRRRPSTWSLPGPAAVEEDRRYQASDAAPNGWQIARTDNAAAHVPRSPIDYADQTW